MENLETIKEYQRAHFYSGATRSIAYRKAMLRQLDKAIQSFEPQILNALYRDLRKSEFEAYSNEIGLVYAEIHHAIRHLRKWMKKRRRKLELHLLPGRAYTFPEPYGVALIIAPWNYPFQLLFSPLVGALAAGNTAILKPSEFAPATAKVVSEMVKEFFPPEALTVVNGDIRESSALLDMDFDFIFFTGSVPVGKLVMQAAAKRLTPLVLELGGKSPAFIDESANIQTTADKIVWSKFNNAGQTCVAPDYLLVHESIKETLIKALGKSIQKFYGSKASKSSDYARIIHSKHFDRLIGFLNPEQIVIGGDFNRDDLYIAPTVLDGIKHSDSIMQEEIFGPLLPVLTYQDLDQAITEVRKQAKPLALYVFSRNKKNVQKITQEISFGGGGINNALLHVASVHLPFGGVGTSGNGQYHGKAGFDAFSHTKSILEQPAWPDPGLAYPHKKIPLGILRFFLH